ncbi:AttE component of AttEFGH ABC transport system [Vibrio sp. JCM 18904]|nr:AttE component of AttEFGH ABC transport system [Vibrio sp. JCM 18904]
MLKLSDLCKGYVDGGGEFHPVLQGAELTLQQGDQVALMGESGSGKSTLLNLIAGLDTADSGEVQFPNFAMHEAPEHLRTLYRRNNIGNIFQQFNLLPTLNIADNIRFCRQLKGLPEDKELWRQILSALDLMPLLGRYPEEASGGQQQRAAIARALYMEPKILLADEPTGSLDERNAEAVMRLLTSLARQLECTLLLVTHSEKVAAHMEGKIRLQGGQLHVMARS